MTGGEQFEALKIFLDKMEQIKLKVDAGAAKKKTDLRGKSCLQKAASSCRLPAVKCLLIFLSCSIPISLIGNLKSSDQGLLVVPSSLC